MGAYLKSHDSSLDIPGYHTFFITLMAKQTDLVHIADSLRGFNLILIQLSALSFWTNTVLDHKDNEYLSTLIIEFPYSGPPCPK